ncbi:hypothetical protein [Halovulum sp. GXIMD14793]
MSNFETIKEDLVVASEAAKEFVGVFIYEPLGIESSATLNAFTLYLLLGIAGMALYRLSKPMRQPRYRNNSGYHYGRNV